MKEHHVKKTKTLNQLIFLKSKIHGKLRVLFLRIAIKNAKKKKLRKRKKQKNLKLLLNDLERYFQNGKKSNQTKEDIKMS